MRLILFAALFVASLNATQALRSPLGLRVLQGGYWDAIYTEPPTGMTAFVFFVGEPVRLRLAVASIGAGSEVVLHSLEPSQLFPLTATRDSAPAGVDVAFSADISWRASDGRLLPVTAERRMRLKDGEGFEWRAEVVNRLEPGLYRFLFDMRAADGENRPVIPYVADFEFEVRPATAESWAEIARRSAMRHLDEGDRDAAVEAIRLLVRQNPNSIAAEMLRARLEMERGRRDAARAHYQLALRRLEQGDDVMLRRFQQPRTIERLRESLKRLANERH